MKVAIYLLWLLPGLVTADTGADEIEYLLQFVASSQCDFERNGDLHEAADAAQHLRLKLSKGNRYVVSAEDFITLLTSKSSWSGKPYYAICDKQRIRSSQWLSEALMSYRNKRGSE